MGKNLLPDKKKKVPRKQDTFWKMLLHKWIATLVFVAFLVILLLGVAIFCELTTLEKITKFFNELSYSVVRILKAC